MAERAEYLTSVKSSIYGTNRQGDLVEEFALHVGERS